MHDEEESVPHGRFEETHPEEPAPSSAREGTPAIAASAETAPPEGGELVTAEASPLTSPEPERTAESEPDHDVEPMAVAVAEGDPEASTATTEVEASDPEAVAVEVVPPTVGPEAPPQGAQAAVVTDSIAAETTGAGSVPPELELEELTLPSSIPSLEPLPDGALADPQGSITVERLREKRGRVNRYLATRVGESGEPLPVELLEAPADHLGLQREAEMLSQVKYPMLPRLFASWERDGRRYLAFEPLDGPTLGEALEAGLDTDEVISITIQLAQVLRQLHRAGWALVGLSPEGVYLGQPIRVSQVGATMRIGEAPSHALHVPGYSAPELAHQDAITGKEDVYTLGALLYHGLSRQTLPEQGPELATLAASVPVPGAPQLLAPALEIGPDRLDLEEFYHRLLAFKRRLSLVPLALRVASGTSIGLNQTRLANEDACGYLTWCSMYEGRVVYNAVLCAIDGMGGMEAGEVASTAALRAALRVAAEYSVGSISGAEGTDLDTEAAAPTGPSQRQLDPKLMVHAAAEAAYVAARGRQVGATITCGVIEDGKLRLAHVGDTRAYLLHAGELTQLTRDHSLVATMVESGMLTKDQARGHPESNKVLRSLGGQKTLPPDYIDGLAVTQGEDVLQLQAGDTLLFCSDGVWGVLDDDALLEICTESPDLETAVRTVIRRVLEGGAPDNAAIVVARCVTMPAS